MATISIVNDVLCVNISKIDDILKSNVKYFDDNVFCQQTTPTPTPTKTQTPTPTPTRTPASVTPTPTITPTSTPPSVTPTPTPTQFATKCMGGHIPKDTVYSYVSCCYPFGYITGTSGPDTDGYDVCYFPYSASTGVTSTYVECEISALTKCCQITMSYTELEPFPPCDMGGTGVQYYISAPCLETLCDLTVALAIYSDDSCTTVAPDGYYTDGIGYATISGGNYTYGGPC